MPELDHLEILEMICDGLFGCAENTLGYRERVMEWPQIRPALEKAIEDIKELRKIKSDNHPTWMSLCLEG